MALSDTLSSITSQVTFYSQAALLATQLVEGAAPPNATSVQKAEAGAAALTQILSSAPNQQVAQYAALGNAAINAAVLVQNLLGVFKNKPKQPKQPTIDQVLSPANQR